MNISFKEQNILENKYDEGIRKFRKSVVTVFVFAFIVLILPVQIWNIIIIPRKRLHNLPDVEEPMFKQIGMILLLVVVIILTIFLSYYTFVYLIKKDLKFKEKIGGKYRVVKVEHLRRNVAEKLDGLDTVLHFEKNNTKINRHLFKKSEKPELLNAKYILIECTKYSRTILKEEIVMK